MAIGLETDLSIFAFVKYPIVSYWDNNFVSMSPPYSPKHLSLRRECWGIDASSVHKATLNACGSLHSCSHIQYLPCGHGNKNKYSIIAS